MYSHLRKLQIKLAEKVKICPLENTKPKLVAGVDVSFERKTGIGFCCIAVLNNDMNLIQKAFHTQKIKLPYIPGLLSFRELPIIYQTMQKLRYEPDIYILDSQGIAHPRFLGLASHFGVVFNKVSVGCAKNRLVGEYQEPGLIKGSFSIMHYKHKEVGAVVRTKNNVKPVFISPGNLIDTQDSINIILKYARGYRIPEPTRIAHILSNRLRKESV
ncbi:Endonuclease V [Flexistipes sinusarabici DSM 4947]|uniref:Endonuclease V n=2 Tax=Flexistipes sinusarabici TaxID=2352 RepID=F8E4Z7_FLESM|nr:endonuclease V [Flexistipes sinusarabici]AEI14567.1 Endonuclease V [Flexistipes sinusarabici DSM 4947]